MSIPKETRTSPRIKEAEVEKQRKKEAEDLAKAEEAKKRAEKRSSNSSQGSSTDKENEVKPKKKKDSPPKKVTLPKSSSKKNVKVPSSSGPSTSRNATGPSDDSGAELSEPKKESTSSRPKDEPEEPEEPIEEYIKYDRLPNEWAEPNWGNRQLVIPARDARTLFRPLVANVTMGEDENDDIVEYIVPPCPQKAMIPEPRPVLSPNEHMQLMHAIQNFAHKLNRLDTTVFEGMVKNIDRIVEAMQLENKTKRLNLYAIHFDRHMYQTFCRMKPKNLCHEEAIFVYQFFELFKVSIKEFYNKDQKTKEEMIDILQNNIMQLRIYGEKMVIPCHNIVDHINSFVDQILKESRAQF